MNNSPDILFTDRFQMLFDHLGVFTFIYYRQECKGIDRQEFITQTQFYKVDTDSIISMLVKHDLLSERDGILHLNRRKFFSMTMWDLLIITEPWLNREAPPGEGSNYSALKQFARSEKICTALTPI